MLSIVKSFEILSKHDGYGFISEPFAFNWYIFRGATNEEDTIASPLPKSKIPFFLLSKCTGELLTTPKIMTFLFPSYHPVMKIGNMYRIQYHNHYIHIYKNQNFWLTSQLQISNDLSWNLPLNLLTMEFFFLFSFFFYKHSQFKNHQGKEETLRH